MTEWVFFFIVPLLVLPIVLLFRFVGCGLDRRGELDEPLGTPRRPYMKMILDEPSVLAYWRLVDGTKAKEEKGSSPSVPSPLDGEYKEPPDSGLPHEIPTPIPGSEPPTTSPGSEGTSAGGFTTGVDSLIFDPVDPVDHAKCRAFNGGYVFVAGFSTVGSEGVPVFKYPDDFTIEAWIDAQWTQKTGYEHTLIGAGGNYRRPLDPPSPSWHGFRIFADRDDRWQVYLARTDGRSVPVKMETAAPIVIHSNDPNNKPPPEPTYLAVTVEPATTPGHKKVTIFVNGNKITEGTADRYSPPNGAPLFIGVSNMESNPSNPQHRPRHPVMSPIQEVVLYSTALTPAVITKHHDAGKGIA